MKRSCAWPSFMVTAELEASWARRRGQHLVAAAARFA